MLKKLLLAALWLPLMALAQSYPSPTYQNLTILGTINVTGAPTFTSPVKPASGGTGLATLTAHGLMLGEGTGNVAFAGPSATSGLPLLSAGSNADPAFSTLGLSALTAVSPNTVVANATSASAAPTAFGMPSCSTSSNALNYTTNNGIGCNSSINAATLGGATFATPGPIGSTTPSTGAFTTLSASTSNPSLNFLANGTGAVARGYASKFGDVVSAIDFGADPTGSADSTASIQAAINAVTASGGTVVLPIGTYKVTASLVMPTTQFVSLVGMGKGSQIVNSSGASFDMITWANPGAGNLILTYATIGNMSLSQSGGTGSAAEINTQYASTLTIRDVYFNALAASGDGVKIVGNGATYSHEIQIINFSGRSNQGNAVIHLTGTASDDLISGGVYEGLFHVNFGIQLDNGVGTVQMQNLHISNFATNVITTGTMVGVLQATNCIFDSATLETAYFNGLTNAVFVNTHFMFPGATHSGVSLNNASGNQFKSTIVESASGSNAAWAVVENGTSNSNSFDGLTTTGTFSSGIASLLGVDSFVDMTGHMVVLGGNGAITASGTLYFANGAANASEAVVQFVMPYAGYIRKVIIQGTSAPGASQTYTATVRKNASNSTIVATMSGASSFGTTATGFISVNEGDSVDVQVVASSGAASSTLRVTLVIGY